MKTPLIEIYESADGKWYWRLRAKNGEIVWDGAEGFVTRSNAKRAARRVKQLAMEAEIRK